MRGRPPALMVLVAMIIATLGLTGPASAAPVTGLGHDISTVTTVMTISYPDGSVVTHRSVSTATVTPDCPAFRTGSVVSPACPGDPPKCYCNTLYTWPDTSGYETMTYQHACGGSTSPWGIKLSAFSQAVMVGDVTEIGMTWRRNGVTQGRQAGHVEPPDYPFHGTFNPVHAGDFLDYSDTFDFVAQGGGVGTLITSGSLSQVT